MKSKPKSRAAGRTSAAKKKTASSRKRSAKKVARAAASTRRRGAAAAKSTKATKRAKSVRPAKAAKSAKAARTAKTAKKRARLLAGGNPQIAKAHGDAPVQAYIAAMPDWKREVGQRIDDLVTRTVPGVRKAVKWNSPFYGAGEGGWFLSFHTYTRYVKIAFFRGASLTPLPPGGSKSEDTRYLDIHEHELLDEEQMVDWIRQAAALPGWGA